jgi:hypothetical protein
MFSCFLLFPKLGLPAMWHRTAMALLVAELVALGVWSYGSPGEPLAEAGRMAAAIVIPLLSLALVVFTVAHGVIYFRRNEDPRHRLARQGRLGDRDRAA